MKCMETPFTEGQPLHHVSSHQHPKSPLGSCQHLAPAGTPQAVLQEGFQHGNPENRVWREHRFIVRYVPEEQGMVSQKGNERVKLYKEEVESTGSHPGGWQ